MKKVLLVDDDVIVRELTELEFLSRGWECSSFENGYFAVDNLKTTKYDLIVLDIQMPIIDGIETLKLLREFDSKSRVILLTGYISDNHRALTKNLNVFKIFSKPLDYDDLFELLDKEKIFDKDKLNQYAQIDEKMIKVFLDKFLDTYKDNILDLHISKLSEDYDESLLLIHTVKGAASLIGATNIFKYSSNLEQAMRDFSTNLYEINLSRLKESFYDFELYVESK